MMSQQVKHLPRVRLDNIKESLKSLVLPKETVEIAALAAESGRSLFLFGPAGNGKTSLGRLLHDAQSTEVWVPYAISVGQGIVRVFDPSIKDILGLTLLTPEIIDQKSSTICLELKGRFMHPLSLIESQV